MPLESGIDALESEIKQHIGTSRGGSNTKVHALVIDEFNITGRQVQDSKIAISLLEATDIAFVCFNADIACPNKQNVKIIYKFDKG